MAGPKPELAAWQDPAAAPLVEIRNVTKTFDGHYAVDDVSLSIYPGEFFSLLGASGCGKTTLLRMLAGFERPDAGRLLIGGQDVTELPPYKRPVNMMFQSYALFPHLSVAGTAADRPGTGGGLAAGLYAVARRSGDREFHLGAGRLDPA
jgi:putrescine transport system ATP-binding protein